MHIAIFVDFHESSMGGVQTAVRAQRSGLEDLGHQVTIFSPPPVGSVTADRATVCIPAVPLLRPNGFPMVAPTSANRKLIEGALDRRSPVDVLHVQTNMGLGILGVLVAARRAIPLVQTMHGRDDVFAQITYPLPRLTTAALKVLHRRLIPHRRAVHPLEDGHAARNAWAVMVNHAEAADHIIIPSRHFAERFRERGTSKPITVISNGIADAVVDSLGDAPRHATGIDRPLRILWCGRLSPEKRPIEAIEAASLVDGCRLDIYGEGPWSGRVQKFIDTRGLSDRVRLKGRVSQDEILAAMREHDVLLYPSYGFDNQPMVLLEAAAAGLPIVYCDPDLAECIPHGGGLRADDPGVDALARAIDQVRVDVRLRHRMHDLLRSRRDDTKQSNHSKQAIEIYLDLIAGKSART